MLAWNGPGGGGVMTSRSGWLAFALIVLLPQPGWAWGHEGHRIIALIADRMLQSQDAAARGKVREILATDTANELTKTDIASEATWADVLREKSPEAGSATSQRHYCSPGIHQPH